MNRSWQHAMTGRVGEVVDDRQQRFEELYDAHSGAILAYAARRTPNIHDAADVLAETFTVAWRRLDHVPPAGGSLPWLYGVARRVLANQRRSDDRRHRLYERWASELAGESFVIETPDDRGEVIAQALARLRDSDRELLTLVAWEGLAPAEIALMLGTTNAVVRVRLHRARSRLERELAEVGLQRSAASGHGIETKATAFPDQEES